MQYSNGFGPPNHISLPYPRVAPPPSPTRCRLPDTCTPVVYHVAFSRVLCRSTANITNDTLIWEPTGRFEQNLSINCRRKPVMPWKLSLVVVNEGSPAGHMLQIQHTNWSSKLESRPSLGHCRPCIRIAVNLAREIFSTVSKHRPSVFAIRSSDTQILVLRT